MLARALEFCKYGIQYACFSHCIFEYLADFVVCNGPSMEPTLYSNNILLTERITTRFHNYKRGDIIIAVSPTNPAQYICKRIVGVCGDKVVPIKQEVEHKDDYLISEYVPKGSVWIEGDNKSNSSDSRTYGPIPCGLIKSRVICRLWPLTEMKALC